MSDTDSELGMASECLRGARQALERAFVQRPDLRGIGLLNDKLRTTERQLHELINTKRERES